MKLDKKEKLIEKYLKKKKEKPLLELIIKNYNNSNFYISLLYNSNIEKFKVLYIPLDVVDNTKIEEYCCYQFMEVKSVEYIIEQIKEALPKYQEQDSRNRQNINVNNFLIQLNIYNNNQKYDFYTTRYLPKDWQFLFEAIVMLFEHTPNIMGELAIEILSVIMNTNEDIEYQLSIPKSLNDDSLLSYFETSTKNMEVSFLEKVDGKYYAIISNHLIIIEENCKTEINIFCDKKELVTSEYVYTVIEAIKANVEKRFYKIHLTDTKKNKNYNYLCLGLEKNKLKLIEKNKLKLISLSSLKNKKINILEDHNHYLEKALLKAQNN